MKNVHRIHATVVAAIVASAGSLAAQAQGSGGAEERSGAIEEIIVTSRRVAENLQSVPVSVAVFRAEDLEKLGVANVADTANFTPNFLSNGGPTGQNDGFYFVRGVGQVDLNPATDPGVGTYIDGVYLGRVIGSSFDSLDVARIEVLRGPQGTLFGRNTVGGAVNVVTGDPGDTWQGDVRVVGGERNLLGGQAKISGPISDTLGFSASLLKRQQDGWGENPFTGQTFGDLDNTAGRLKFVWQPSEDFSARLAADASRVRGTSQHQILVGFNPGISSPLGVRMAPQVGADLNTGNIYENRSSILDPRSDVDVNGVSLSLDWNLGAATLKSITAYRELEQFARGDFDGGRINFYQSEFTTDQDQLSQELQLTVENERWTGVLGAFYYEESAFHNNYISLGSNNGCLLAPLPFPFGGPPPPLCGAAPYATAFSDRSIANNQQLNVDIESLAAYAHATYRFSDTWSASVGLRWTEEEKTQAYDFFIDNTRNVLNATCVPPGIPGFPPTGLCFPVVPPGITPTLSPRNPMVGVPTTYSETWSEVTPKLGIEYKPSDRQLYYLSYSEGFKSGGFNGRPTPGPTGTFAAVQAYDPELLETYELGAKTQFLDDRVRLNAAYFFSQYQDIQLLVLGPSGFFENRNAGEADIQGVEVELLARPTPDFELSLNVGYMDQEYTSLTADALRSGFRLSNRLPMTPEWNGALGLQYAWSLGAGSLAVRGDYIYRSEVFFGAQNGPLERQGALGLLNARVRYDFPGEAMSLSVYANNLTDEEFFTNGQDVRGPLGIAFVGVGEPREVGVEFVYRFGR
jgi:iron complex outermembrane receptor protein